MKTFVALLALSLSAPAFASGVDAKAVWTSKCKGCHGPDGKADTRMGRSHKIVDFTAPAFQQKVTDAQLRAVIVHGSKKDSKMKAFKDRLTPEEISALVRYIRALGSKP